MFLAAFKSALQAYPQATQRNTAWLSRDSRATCPHALQRCEVYAADIFWTLPGAFSSNLFTRSPQPEAWMPRLRCQRPARSRVTR
jgi:hypothetical protein